MAPQIITSSKWPRPDFVRKNLFELITSNPNNVPDDKPAFIRAADGKAYSREQMFRDARRLAHAYVHKLKLKKGDRIGVFSPNSCFYPIAMWAGFISGVILVPMNPGYGAEELVHPVHDSAFKYLFVHPSTLKVGRDGLKEAGSKMKTQEGINSIWIMSDNDSMEKGDAGEQDVRTLLGEEEMQPIKVDDPENTLAFIAYSSGTTGRSKGTLLTHYNMTSNSCLLKVMFQGFIEANDVQLGVLPFQHIFALSKNICHAPFVGCSVVVLPKFDLTAWLEAVQRHKITVTMIVPPILVLLAKSPIVEKYDLSSLKAVMSGAAPLSAELGDEVEARIPTLKVTQGYGLTETSPTVSYTPPDLYKHAKGSAGMLAPGVEMRLVDDEGKDVGLDQGDKGNPGELWFRGPNIFKGYLNNKEATEDCMTKDGFFKTGDVAIYLKDQIYIVDRKKELIKYKGFQVAPAELEALLLQHPKVADAAVLGLYSKDEATELPRAYVVPREGLLDIKDAKACDAFAKEVRTWADGKVSNHKKLRAGVRVLEQIPKSPSGKILRRVLKDQATAEGGAIRAKL